MTAERPICPHCGTLGAVDARCCAHCGRSLIPLGARLEERVSNVLDRLAAIHIWGAGLVLLISIGVLSNRPIIWKLSFRVMILIVALVIGGGMAYLGWATSAPISTQRHLFRMLLVIAGVVVSLVAIQFVDEVLLLLYTDGADRVI